MPIFLTAPRATACEISPSIPRFPPSPGAGGPLLHAIIDTGDKRRSPGCAAGHALFTGCLFSSNPQMITACDHFIVAFYLLFVLGVGLVFRRMSKNTSNYFRAGGAMPWWITGTSAWIAGFSAWTFTGAAGMIYETGTIVLCLYYSGLIAFVFVLFFTCARFRRIRVDMNATLIVLGIVVTIVAVTGGAWAVLASDLSSRRSPFWRRC
jgi:hypothetical protein